MSTAPRSEALTPRTNRDQQAGDSRGSERPQDSQPVEATSLRLLVVDDEEKQRRILQEILAGAGYPVESVGSAAEAVDRVRTGGIDLVLTDLRMPGASGLELLAEVKSFDPEIEVVLMTAFSDVKTAVEAMRLGAHDYLAKPFEKEELLLTIGKVGEHVRLRRENRDLRSLVEERRGFGKMLGRAPAMQEIYRTIEKVSSGASTVLIRGESGTGKELVARAIHNAGERRDRPFIAINCAAIPEMLIESELFGHEKGAFTGALTSKVGRFEEVLDGTLFLDEIGSMQYDLQAKLLRVIQEREFQRIGGSKMLRFGGRIVAATSQDLEQLMGENLFREDLYFRLNVVPIQLPALRERIEDLPLLATHFLEKYSEESSKALRCISPRALDLLSAHSWPGNVRELENLIERVVVLSDDGQETIEADMLPGSVAGGEPAARHQGTMGGSAGAGSAGAESAGSFALPDDGLRLADLERELIRQALEKSGGKLEPAAALLGITYKTLQYRIRKYGLKKYQVSR